MSHSPAVIQRFTAPQFVQQRAGALVGCAGTRLAGVQIELHLQVVDGLHRAGFRAYGCPATVASADWLAETISSAEFNPASLPDKHQIIRALDLPPARHHCAATAIEAMRKAFDQT